MVKAKAKAIGFRGRGQGQGQWFSRPIHKLTGYSHRWLLHFRNTSWLSSFFPSLARLGRIIKPLWLKMRSTGADVAGVEKTFSSSGCSIWIVVSAFSCNHGSLLAAGDDACSSASSRYFSTAPRTVTPAEVVAAIKVRRRL